VPLMSYTLHYGLGAFEGIRAYDGDKGPAVFRLTEHMERLHRSCRMIRMELPYTAEQLTDLARHCTLQEDNAAKVERQVRKSAAALLLAPRVGQRFDAIVTGASPKGTWVRILHPAVEGRVVRGDHGLDVGDAVRVDLVDTDVERGFIDFARV